MSSNDCHAYASVMNKKVRGCISSYFCNSMHVIYGVGRKEHPYHVDLLPKAVSLLLWFANIQEVPNMLVYMVHTRLANS